MLKIIFILTFFFKLPQVFSYLTYNKKVQTNVIDKIIMFGNKINQGRFYLGGYFLGFGEITLKRV